MHPTPQSQASSLYFDASFVYVGILLTFAQPHRSQEVCQGQQQDHCQRQHVRLSVQPRAQVWCREGRFRSTKGYVSWSLSSLLTSNSSQEAQEEPSSPRRSPSQLSPSLRPRSRRLRRRLPRRSPLSRRPQPQRSPPLLNPRLPPSQRLPKLLLSPRSRSQRLLLHPNLRRPPQQSP
jgi:hypothetical protein